MAGDVGDAARSERETRSRESVGRVLLVAFAVALFCSLLVSSAVYWLRPLQSAFQASARNQAILVAAGVFAPGDAPSERDVLAQALRIEARLADLDSGELLATDSAAAAAFDYRAAIDDPSQQATIAPAEDTAGLGTRPRTMPVYLIRDGARIERVVVPVYGRGMWSVIHGYIGLESDLNTIAGVTFYDHGETPGIGDRIAAPEWLRNWRGKTVYAPDGSVTFRIGGQGGDASTRVDSITGATVTTTAVDRFVRFWLGAEGFGKVFDSLRDAAS